MISDIFKNKQKRNIILFLVVVLVVLATLYGALSYRRTLVEDEMARQQAGRFDGTYAMYTYPPSARPGSEVTVYGVGFLRTGNSIYLGDKPVASNVSSPDFISLVFRLPPDTEAGVYDVSVKNAVGEVKNRARLIVTSSSASMVPHIADISPAIAKFGDKITLSGSGFVGHNTIRTSFGVFENVVSDDGATLIFNITPPSEGWADGITSQKEDDVEKYLDVWVVVENAGGISNSARFQIVPR